MLKAETNIHRIAGGPTRGQLAMHLRGMLVKLNVVESLLSGQLEGRLFRRALLNFESCLTMGFQRNVPSTLG